MGVRNLYQVGCQGHVEMIRQKSLREMNQIAKRPLYNLRRDNKGGNKARIRRLLELLLDSF